MLIIMYQEKIGLLFHNVGREEYIWHLSDAPGFFLVVSCPRLDGTKLQQLWLKKGISDQGVRLLSSEDMGHPPGKLTRLVQVLAKRRGQVWYVK